MTSIKDNNTVIKVRKLARNHPNLHLVSYNKYPKFGQILSIRSIDIERKEILTKNMGPNSVTN